MKIPFNIPYFTEEEHKNILACAYSGHVSGNGLFTKKCHHFFEKKFSFNKVLLTHSCTHALEMSAILSDIQPGDEVIMPSYTFVSTANAFVLRGAKIVFADVEYNIPNISLKQIESLINPRTKAIVVVHYAGVAIDMDALMGMAKKHDLIVIEDAAHAMDSYYKGKPLGSIGHFGTFSFHETKNIISGEGGLLAINDEKYIKRAEIIWEKGTNRAAFQRGEVNKYNWVDVGSSFLPSDLTAAFLYAQLEHLPDIQKKRKKVWKTYDTLLKSLKEEGKLYYPNLPDYASQNGNMFYILVKNNRNQILEQLNKKDIQAVFHYLPLHQSPYFKDKHDERELPNTLYFSEHIIRLPFFTALTTDKIEYICNTLKTILDLH